MGGPKQKGVYSYTMSPVRQKAFYGVLHGYLFNGVRRLSKQLPYFGIPMAIGECRQVAWFSDVGVCDGKVWRMVGRDAGSMGRQPHKVRRGSTFAH